MRNRPKMCNSERVKKLDYDVKENGKRMIYCTYADTEIASLWTSVQCPYCGHLQKELDMNDCGTTYTIQCENEDCEKEYEMHFDAS